MVRLHITDEAQVDTALCDPRLRPPDPPPSLGAGSTAALRRRMARFSSGADHPDRRAAVEDLAASLDHNRLEAETAAAAACALAGAGACDVVDAVALAATVPTAALLTTLGWPARVEATGDSAPDLLLDRSSAVADVTWLAAAIGRGAVVTAVTDAAVDSLLRAAETLGLPADAAVSVLYQNVDATAALILTTVHGLLAGSPRSPAVVRTVRVVDEPVAIAGSVALEAGVEVELDLTVGGREFGFGPHACPGRATAEVIVAAVVAALTGDGWTTIDAIELGANGIPTRLDLRR